MKEKLIILGAVVAVVALACGGDTADTTTDELPPATAAPAGAPDAASTCLVGTPDCDDTPDVGEEPLFVEDEPRDGEAPSSGDSSGLVVGGGLSVEEALETDAEGTIAVQGFIVAEGGTALLCDLLAESFPPQCGGASLEVANLDSIDPDDLTTSQSVTWSDLPVTLLGEIVDGILVPTPMAT